jgi:hypothetical protein
MCVSCSLPLPFQRECTLCGLATCNAQCFEELEVLDYRIKSSPTSGRAILIVEGWNIKRNHSISIHVCNKCIESFSRNRRRKYWKISIILATCVILGFVLSIGRNAVGKFDWNFVRSCTLALLVVVVQSFILIPGLAPIEMLYIRALEKTLGVSPVLYTAEDYPRSKAVTFYSAAKFWASASDGNNKVKDEWSDFFCSLETQCNAGVAKKKITPEEALDILNVKSLSYYLDKT